MNKIFVFGFFCLFMVSCVSTSPKPLYSWGNYQEKTYAYVKNNTDKSLDELMTAYLEIMNKQKGSRGTVPPGICADYGYLLYTQGKTEEGIAFLNKEVELYPESSVFISRIIKNLQNEDK